MADFYDKSKSQLSDDVIFIVDTFSGKSKASGNDFYKITFVACSRDGKKSFVSDKFVDRNVFKEVLSFGYYRVKTVGVRGDWESLTPIKAVAI